MRRHGKASSAGLASCRRTRWSALAFLCTSLAALASAPAAFAALTYVSVGQIPAPGSTPSSFGHILAESAVVNDKNGHILVADSGRGLVYDFTSASDTSPTVWNGSKTPSGSFGVQLSVATDNSTGDVYVADVTHALVDKFDSSGNLIASFGDTTPSPNGQLTGAATPAKSFSINPSYYSSFPIAVDQKTGDLYVADPGPGHQVIDVFDSSGKYLRQITATPAGLYTGGGAYTTGIAVNAASGNVYVADWGGPDQVYVFDSSGNYVSALNGSNTPDGNFGGGGGDPISVATDDTSGHVFVQTYGYSDVNIFDSSGNFLPPQLLGLSNSEGVAVDQASGRLYVSSNDANAVEILTPAIVPDVTLNPPSNLSATGATLNGHVDPAGGGDITGCHFEYISNSHYTQNTSQNGGADPWGGAQQAPCSPATPLSSPTNVSATVTGLSPGIGYHYRLVVTNANGTVRVASQFASVGRYQFSADFGSAGAGAGQLTNPQDVAVDSSGGDIYVADTGNHRVVKFDSSGKFLAAWGWGVSDGNGASEVCTSGCQAGIPGSGAGQFTTPTFIKVDNSTGPSAGDVYVGDTANSIVQKFDANGNFIANSYSGGIGGMTVDPTGDLIVSSVALIEVDSFGGTYVAQLPGYGVSYKNPATPYAFDGLSLYPPNAPTINSGLTVDRSTNDLYVDQGTYVDQFAAAPGCGGHASTGNTAYPPTCYPSDFIGFGNLNSAAGLAINPSTGVLYAANAGDNDIAVFTPLPLPNVTTNPVTNQGPASATLSGHVDPHGAGTVTGCHFEYGTDTTYSLGNIPCSPTTPLSGPTDVSADVSGLTPFTTYHFRLVASGASDFGLLSYGRDRSFTPVQGGAPGVDATSSPSVAPTGATLSAQINPNLAPTIYRFQYGTGSGYGSQTLPSDSIGADGTDHVVNADITDLTPGTTYHFRVLAVNFNGPTKGPDQTFNTPDLPAVGGTAASAITQTAATLSAQVKPGFRPTTYRFEYGTPSAYGASTPESTPIGSDNSVHTAAANISGLAAGTTYHFRVVASNVIGITDGPDQTFTTTAAPLNNGPPPLTCKRGFVKRHGACVKAHHKRHHKRSARHG